MFFAPAPRRSAGREGESRARRMEHSDEWSTATKQSEGAAAVGRAAATSAEERSDDVRGDGSAAPPSIAIDRYLDGLYLWSFRGAVSRPEQDDGRGS